MRLLGSTAASCRLPSRCHARFQERLLTLKEQSLRFSWYAVANAGDIPSPSLLVYPERVMNNINQMLHTVGDIPSRLRPHVKTHKMAEVIRMQLNAGITSFKASTIPEMEVAAGAGATDVLLAHQPVGPTIRRLLELSQRYENVKFSTIVDDHENLKRVAQLFSNAGKNIGVYADLDVGMGRTGVEPGEKAIALCEEIDLTNGVSFEGIHAYDGHIHDVATSTRQKKYAKSWTTVLAFVSAAMDQGLPISNVIAGGSPSFPFHARYAKVHRRSSFVFQCSPGTTLFWDARYALLEDMQSFQMAATILTRIISKPGDNTICLDLGHKSVASENPLDKRAFFPDIPSAVPVQQSEEHLVLQVDSPDNFKVGDILYAIPFHICPTVALHQEAWIVSSGQYTGERWKVAARDRRISI